MRKGKYYQMSITGREASLNIYGNITSWPWMESDVAAYDVKKEIDELDVDTINVFINSYGGEVSEALAIYSALKRNKATVKTYCDGFACSAATIVFAAGDERVMGSIALLMIHNCMSYAGYANSNELRKAADDNDKINQSSIEAYKKILNISEEEIKQLMDDETWITATEAKEMGFATQIADEEEEGLTQQSVQQSLRKIILDSKEQKNESKLVLELKNLLATVQKGDDQDNLDEGEENPEDQEDPEKDDETDDNPDDKDGEKDPDEDDGEENSEQKGNQKAIAFFNALSK